MNQTMWAVVRARANVWGRARIAVRGRRAPRQQRTVRGLLPLLMLLLLPGFAGAASQTEVRRLDGFSRISFALPGQLTLRRGGSVEVVVEAAPGDLKRIRTEVRGDELAIGWDDGVPGMFRGDPAGDIQVRVTLPALQELDVSGSGRVDGGTWLSETFTLEVSGSGSAVFEELVTEELDIEVSGSGNVDAAKVDAAMARVEISGSGDVELAGAADRQHIEVMGSGDVIATELEGASVEVEITGSGDVAVWATENLSAEITGSGGVRYRGAPRVERELTGSGSVRAL